MYRLATILLIVLVFRHDFLAQGSPEIEALIDSSRHYAYKDGQKAINFARKAYRLGEEMDDYWGILNALQLVGEGYFTIGTLDSATFYFERAMDVAVKENDDLEIANCHISLASVQTQRGKHRQAIHSYQAGMAIQSEIGDSSGLCDALLRYGNVFSSIGAHDTAAVNILQAIRICEAINRPQMVAYCYGALGIIADKQKDYSRAESYYDKALSRFEELEDTYSIASVNNNLGILYKNTGRYEKAVSCYDKAVELFTELGVERGVQACMTNQAIVEVELGHYESGFNHARMALDLATKLGNVESQQDNLNTLARASLGLGLYREARQYADKSLALATELGSLEKLRDVHLTRSQISRTMARYEDALDAYAKYVEYKDSIFNLERSAQINELQTIYQTEKKDREIQLLAKNAELDRLRKTRLWIAIILIALAGGILVWGQIQRRQRDKKIHAQQQELSEQKRKNVELERKRLETELSFKQKELTAKVLRLARKNTFLQELQRKVRQLRDRTDGETRDEVRRLGRMIDMDVATETDWNDFLSVFREVHTDFQDKLIAQYDDLTRSDLKLACLMKMNMSSKEIASLLNISAEGVKKARYRLRKKMGVSSDTNLHEYFLALN